MQFATPQDFDNLVLAYDNHQHTSTYYYQEQDPAMTTASSMFYKTDETALPVDDAQKASRMTSSAAANRKRPKRKQVKNACINCQKACKKCDDGRPCQRCIKLGLVATCINSPRKERKKGVKRGPYKKRQQRTASNASVPTTVSQQSTTTNEWEADTLQSYQQQQQMLDHGMAAFGTTPPLTQQESPLSSSPLPDDAVLLGGSFGYQQPCTDMSCLSSSSVSSSPLSCTFPPEQHVATAMSWWDEGFLPVEPTYQHVKQQPLTQPICYDAFTITSQQRKMTIPQEEPCYYSMPTATMEDQCLCVPPADMSSSLPWNSYQQPSSLPQPRGYWQSFLSAI